MLIWLLVRLLVRLLLIRLVLLLLLQLLLNLLQPIAFLLRIVAAEKKKEIEITTVLREEAFRAIQKGDTETHNSILLEEI